MRENKHAWDKKSYPNCKESYEIEDEDEDDYEDNYEDNYDDEDETDEEEDDILIPTPDRVIRRDDVVKGTVDSD